MSVWLKVFQFYVYSNTHVALAVVSLCLITGDVFDVSVEFSASFLGLSTFFSYNAIRFFKYKTSKLRPELSLWFETNFRLLLLLNMTSFIILLYIFCSIVTLKLLLFLFPFAMVTSAYMTPVFSRKNKNISLRKIPGLKIFIIALTWASLVVVFPLIEQSKLFGFQEGMYLVLMINYVFILTLPFDIRDATFDPLTLKTIPQTIGVIKTKYLGVVLLIINAILCIYFFHKQVWISFVISNLILMVLLCKSSTSQSRFFASFWVEGIPILHYILLVGSEYVYVFK